VPRHGFHVNCSLWRMRTEHPATRYSPIVHKCADAGLGRGTNSIPTRFGLSEIGGLRVINMDQQSTSLDEGEQFSRLVEGVTDYAIYMLDPTGRVVSWNTGAQRIKGYRRDEIVGRPFSTFYTEADRASGQSDRACRWRNPSLLRRGG
jgi:PAS domain-containing protein